MAAVVEASERVNKVKIEGLVSAYPHNRLAFSWVARRFISCLLDSIIPLQNTDSNTLLYHRPY